MTEKTVDNPSDVGNNRESGGAPRVLVLAYDCDPYAGSEAGAGWAVVKTAAAVGDVTVLVLDRHMEAIERWMIDHPEDRDIRFVPIAPVSKGSLLSRMIKLDRRFGFIPYIRWLPEAGRAARQLHEADPFDVSIHGGYGSYWLPTPLVDVEGLPCVWGPVGGGTRTPRGLLKYLGIRGLLGEIQKSLVLAVASRTRSVRRTWEKAEVHVFEGPESAEALPERYRDRARILNRVLLYDLPDFAVRGASDGAGETHRGDFILFPSLLEPRKGPMLAIHALSHAPDDVRLVFVNDGYAEPSLKREAVKLGLEDRVEFLGKIPRDEMFDMVHDAGAVMFAGLREEGGMALVESLMSGAPVVVLAHGGPRVIADHAVDNDRVAAIRPGSSDETARRMGAAMGDFVMNPRASSARNLDDRAKAEMIATLLAACGRSGSPS